MSNFNVRFPDSLYESIKRLAEKNGTSLNQFIVMAVAKEVGWQEAAMYYQNRMNKAASQEDFQHLLQKAPDIEPDNPDDRLRG